MIFNGENYFKDIAINSKFIRHTDSEPHFTTASGILEIEELMSKLTKTTGFQLIYFINKSGSYQNTCDSNLFNTEFESFVLCKQFVLGDMASKKAAIDDCLILGKKIFAKMRKDQIIAAELSTIEDAIGLRSFNQESFKYSSIGIIGDNMIAMQFSFSIGDSDLSVFNDSDWLYNEIES